VPDATQNASPSSGASSKDSNQAVPALDDATDPSSGDSFDNSNGLVELDAIALTAPTGWERKPPSSTFVAAEFVLPRAAGDDADGRLTVSTAGGSVEANIERWKGQFEPRPQQAAQEEIDVAGMKLTIVDFAGDFNDQRGPFGPANRRPDYRMIAAVIPVGGELHFVKATGPKNSIASHADEIHQFIRSVRPTK
jgi:hypothetical protein